MIQLLFLRCQNWSFVVHFKLKKTPYPLNKIEIQQDSFLSEIKEIAIL